MTRHVEADPYPWPYNGDLRPDNTVVLIIDMQTDFCGKGGYVDTMGYDLSLTRAPIRADSGRARGRARRWAITSCTRVRDIAPISPICRPTSAGAVSGSARASAIRDRVDGFSFAASRAGKSFPELAPLPGETVIDKPGKGSFYATDLDLLLHRKSIQNIALAGITTDVCVHTTMRDANDRGYECLLLSDCTGATDYGNHLAALKMIKMQGGVFGAVADSQAFIKAMS